MTMPSIAFLDALGRPGGGVRVALTVLLAGMLLAGVGPLGAKAADGNGADATLQQTMERLYALRTVDTPAFVAEVRQLEEGPPPPNRGQRQFLQFLSANRVAFEGRFADAIARAQPLADSAEDPTLQLAATTFVINMRAGTREFEAGLRELDRLIPRYPDAGGPFREEIIKLWNVAATFYAELGQPSLSAFYAQRILDSNPPPRLACGAKHALVAARLARADATLSEADFDASEARCRQAGETGVIAGFQTLTRTRFLRARGQVEAARHFLERRIDAIEGTGYPRLIAEADALDAELLLAAGQLSHAEQRAQRAIEASKDTPTSLPVAMAEGVLYEIHRQRGDPRAALQHLQRHIAANRTLAEESLAKDRAFRAVQHERLQREQQLALATERNRVLDLEARLAKAESRNAIVLAVVLLLTVVGLVAWSRRLWNGAKHLRELAQTDALTGFATRQHFTEVAAAALDRGRAEARPLMLVAFDLDHFKRINDRHGHLAGDAVLRAVSQAVRAVPSPSPPLAGRIGGEEFAVLLDGVTTAQAADYAEALREAIGAAKATIGEGTALSVTASFGLTGTHEAGHELQALLDRADRALYRAKNEGRNRIIATDRPAAREAA